MGTVVVGAQFTMLELAKRTNNKDVLDIANVLAEKNEVLQDAAWVEANQKTTHVGTKVVSLPSGTWRGANQGVGSSTATTRQHSEPIGRLEDFSDIDEMILDLEGSNGKAVRGKEDELHLEGLGQTLSETINRGDKSDDPNSFNGLSQRYDSLSDANVLGAGGDGSDLTSLWIIEWGPKACHLIYPRGSNIGISAEDKGKVRITPTSSTAYYAYESQFVVQAGMFVVDDRCVQRIANIETSGSENILDDDQIIEALNYMPTAGGSGNTVIYINRVLKTQFDILAKDKANVNYTSDNAFGMPVTRFRGVPVRMWESILNTEDALT
jgi:hypothetical protein